MRVLIVGGVAGGATAAARLRRLDESAEIIVLERSGFVSYANCGLPYFIGGTIQQKSALTLQTPQSFWERFRIDVRVRQEVTAIHPGTKTITIRRLDTGEEYEESYDKLLLSPGAKAVLPSLPGMKDERIFTLRTVEDTYRIHEYIQSHHPQSAVVIGGGFIGLEMAENLHQRGLRVTLLQRGNQLLAPLDYDMACALHAYARSQGIDVLLHETVVGFEQAEEGIRVRREGKEPVTADLVLVAIGVTPETHLAKEAGIRLGVKGSIVVNDHMETSIPDIYAVGDAVEVRHLVSGQQTLISLAGPANKQGRIAADNICGLSSIFAPPQASSVLKLFNMTVASTGINEKQARDAGIPYDKVITFSPSHASYYPGASNMTIKTIYSPTDGKILGAQIVGFDGVDKRIDVLATAIRAGMSAQDLTELDLAYAPPYSSAKDPVNMAGFVIENVRSGRLKQFHWHDVACIQKREDVILLDVRTKEEYAQGHIEGSVSIPLDELRERLDELDLTKQIYVNCHSGLRSYLACCILSGHGFTCYNLSGGFRFYQQVQNDRAFDAAPRHACGVKIQP